MSGIKIKTTDENMHRPAISALADGSLFVYLGTIYMKITIYNGDKWSLNMETGKIIAVPPDCEVEVVELHCEVVKANPYHHCKKPKVMRAEEMEEDTDWTGTRPQPHMSEEKFGPKTAEEIVKTEIKPMEVEEDDRGHNPTGPRVKAKKKRPFNPHRGYQPDATEEIEPVPPPKEI